MTVSRRDALLLGGLGVLGAGAVALPLGGAALAGQASLLDKRLMPTPYRTPFVRPPVATPTASGVDDLGPWVRYDIYQRQAVARFLPVLTTPVLTYDGSAPGPTISVRKGTRVEAFVRNRLPATHPQFGHPMVTSTHLHGSASLPQYDGYASDLTPPGNVKRYQWPGTGYARTMWYHDHARHSTAPNIYSGLAAQFHLKDEVEEALLPQGAFDVPLTITDAMFNINGSLLLDDRDHSGLWGDVILVNGRPWPVLKVQRRVYRFRVLNASLSRAYRPTLSPAGQVHVVATDGGLMQQSQAVTQWKHAPGERYEILIDFRQYPVGRRVELRNLSNRNNRDYDHTDKIMAFDVVGTAVDRTDPHAFSIPQTLVPTNAVMSLTPEMAGRKRIMDLKKSDVTNRFSINNRTWADVEASGFTEVFADPDLDDIEVWEIENTSGGWHHPMHTHLIDFKVLSRNGMAPYAFELGAKDTVYVGEEETIRIVAKFGPHRGKYMIHCHSLPHEDHDMMVQFSVGLKPGEVDVNDPITADPSWYDDEA